MWYWQYWKFKYSITYTYINVNCMPEMKAQADFHITYILVHIVATTNHFYGGEGG